MTLRAYLRVLRERWKLVAVFAGAATLVAIIVTVTTSKVYQARVQLFAASTNTTPNSGVDLQGAAFRVTEVQTLAQIANSECVIKGIRKDAHITTAELSDTALKSKISATAPTGQALIDFQVQDNDKARVAKIANSGAGAFVDVVAYYYSTGSNSCPTDAKPASGSAASTPPLRLVVTQRATEPTDAVSPKPLLNIALGLVLGLLIGAALAVARDILDNRIKSIDSLAKVAGAPAMGTVVDDPKANRHPIAARAGARNLRAENFRQLRANLQFANVDEHPRIIAIASSVPGEGKTMLAANLASALADTGFSVCLVDADLRRPTVAKVMGLPSPVGLSTVLIRQIDVFDALQTAGPNLYVLSSGTTPPNPSEVLASSYVREVVRSLLQKVDYVILDTAPLLPVADGAEVAALADCTLLVARHMVTTDGQVKRAAATLERVDAKLLGVVLNRVPGGRNTEYGYTYYRDGENPEGLGDPGPDTAKHARFGKRPPAAPTPAPAPARPDDTVGARPTAGHQLPR